MTFGGRDKGEELDLFIASSLFDYQRFLTVVSFIVGGALMLAGNYYGSLLNLVAFAYYALIHANPFVVDNANSKQQTWDYLMRFVGLLGALLLSLTKGHIDTVADDGEEDEASYRR